MLSTLAIPKHLQPGDKVAAVSLSWGGAGEEKFRHRYEAGKQQLQNIFGVQVVEMSNTLRGTDYLYRNPQARVDDLHQAFADPHINGVVSCIGGDDSIRLIDKIDLDLIRANPKVFLGYSDTTVTHFMCLKAGLRSYYGPAIMAGFGENTGLFAYMAGSIRRRLVSADNIGIVAPNEDGWTNEYLAWEVPENQNIKRKLHPPMPHRYLQGEAMVSGRLLGGCTDVLPMIIGTSAWPSPEMWQDAILFLENSEEAPSPSTFLHILRNLGAQGILARLNGLIFSRPHNVDPVQFDQYDAMLVKASAEFGRADLPIVTRMDFGHTDPVFTIPYGAMATIDPRRRVFSIDEPGCR